MLVDDHALSFLGPQIILHYSHVGASVKCWLQYCEVNTALMCCITSKEDWSLRSDQDKAE